MREFAIVKEIKNENEIYVLPMITSSCQSCKKGCIKQGKKFQVLNKKRYNVKIGSTVRIGHSTILRSIYGLLSFFVPIVFSIIGLIYSKRFALLFFSQEIIEKYIEQFKAFGVLSFFFSSAIIIFIISRSSLHFSKPEILQVV